MAEDVFDGFEESIAAREPESPWVSGPEGDRLYVPDIELLDYLLAIPIGEGRAQASGRLAKAMDAWCAAELRRAGFDPDEVWPRVTRPRVLPRDVADLLAGLPRDLRSEMTARVLRNRKVAPTEAKILGRVFVKQADVLIAQWSRGAELLISTKSMLSSVCEQPPDPVRGERWRRQERAGPLPLVSLGFLYLLRSTILDESEQANWELAVDMLRKLP